MPNLKPPKGLSKASSAWWGRVITLYELSPGDERILESVCRAYDRLEELRAVIDQDGVSVMVGSRRQVSPFLIEERQQREAIRRALATLNFPVDPPDGA